MKEHEIVSAVAQSAGISSNAHAEHAVRATLTMLGSRLAGGATSDLGSQLPPALAEALPDSGPGEFEDVTGQLPDDYVDRLGTGPIKH